MARRYLVRPLPEPGLSTLPRDVGHHLARVVRVRPGDRVRLFDGDGHESDIEIKDVRGGTVEVDAGAPVERHREPAVRVELAVALPKGNRAEWLFEHGCEVGVAAFRPLATERSQRLRDRAGRWQRIVEAAAGQCDRSHVPIVHPLATLDELVADPSLPAERFVAGAGSALSGAASKSVVVVVGPEGGLSEGEVAGLVEAGFSLRGLGVLTLRTETAALVAAARLLGGGGPRCPG